MKTKEQLLKDSQDLTKAIVNYHNFPLTHSLAIAEQFGKEHKNVMRDIKNIEEKLNKANEDDSSILGAPNNEIYFISKNHYLSKQGKALPLLVINKNVALMLIIGYTGSKAFKIKNEFIKRFNELETEVANKKIEYAGSKGGYKGQFNRLKAENEELKAELLKERTKLNIALKGMVKIAEDIQEVEK